jgi:autotransporter-associated beta strand protein
MCGVKRLRSWLLIGGVLAGVLVVASRDAVAVSQTWSGATSTNFAVGSNWLSGTAPRDDLSNDIGVFAGTVTANQPVLTAGRQINGLAFTTTTGGWTLGGGGQTLLLGASGLSTVGQTSGTNTVSVNIDPRNAGVWKVGTGGTLVVSGSLVGTGGFTFGANTTDVGTLVLSGNSSGYSGNIIGRFGTLAINGATAIGTGRLTLGSAQFDAVTLDNTSGSAVTLTTNNPITVTQGLSPFAGSNSLNLGTGTVTLSRTIDFRINAKTLTLGGEIATTVNGVTKTGSGTLVLSGTSNATGQTTITAGALQANHGAGLNPASFLSLNGGVLQSNGAASFTRTLASSGSGQFQWTANGGGFSAAGGQLTVNVGGDSRELIWGTTAGTNLVGTLKFGSPTADAKTLLQNPINLTTTGTVTRTVDVALGLGNASAEISGAIRNSGGRGNLTKTGAGQLALSGSNSYTGLTTVSEGKLVVNGFLSGTGGVVTAAATILGGAGTISGIVSGSGTISPGNSPGILTAASIDLTGGMDFAFEFSQAGDPTWGSPLASGNDVLRLTSLSSPLVGTAASQNVFNIYFSDMGATYRGGIFTDLNSDFGSLISTATYNYFLMTPGGGTTFNGQAYEPLAASEVTRSVVQVALAGFSGGAIENGYTMQFVVVPEPGGMVLCAIGFLVASGIRWCRRPA